QSSFVTDKCISFRQSVDLNVGQVMLKINQCFSHDNHPYFTCSSSSYTPSFESASSNSFLKSLSISLRDSICSIFRWASPAASVGTAIMKINLAAVPSMLFQSTPCVLLP